MRDPAVKQLKRAYQMNDKDPQVIAALRRNGVIPGPSLKEPEQLAKPSVPKGPLPEVDIKRWQQEQAARAAQGSNGAGDATGAAATLGPRD
jgi:hypothetical protein